MEASPYFHCFLLFLLVSSASACDRCVHQGKSAYYSSSDRLPYGACGYGSMALDFNNGLLAAAASSLYKDGALCGACLLVRCRNTTLCTTKGTKVFLFDRNNNDQVDLVLSKNAFNMMALNDGSRQELQTLGIVDVEYKRVRCDAWNKSLAIRVEESSQRYYLEIKVLYQGGQTEISAVDIAQTGTTNWLAMYRSYGVVWAISNYPTGVALQLRLSVISGYDVKQIYIKSALPADWRNGVIYDTGVKISDVAQEKCSPCDKGSWE